MGARRSGARRAIAILLAVPALGAVSLPAVASAATVTRGYTGAADSWVVPAGIHMAQFTLDGGQGADGGLGARVVATLAVTPGATFTIQVGGKGSGATGGYNGGAAGFRGGGGATDVRVGAGTLADRVLVAGGGGGRGQDGFLVTADDPVPVIRPGGLGGPSAGPGGDGAGPTTPDGGGPGSASAGGTGGGTGMGAGSAGGLGQGGAGGTNTGCTMSTGCGGKGGGGGGGLYGGGGGLGGDVAECFMCGFGGYFGQLQGSGGGGGGSSFVAPPASGTTTQGVHPDDGAVTIEFYPALSATTGDATLNPTLAGATLHGVADTKGEPGSAYFEIGPTTAYGSKAFPRHALEIGSPSGLVSVDIAGLPAETTYHYRFVVTACNGCALGTAFGADRTFTSPPPPAPPGDVGAKRPVVDRFAATPATFRVGLGATALLARRRHAGTVFRLRSSAAGTARIAIARLKLGRRSGRRCVSPTRALRRRPACTRVVAIGALRRAAAPGTLKVPFSGRLGRRALSPGRYRATVVVTPDAGRASAPRSVTFTVVR